VIYLLSRQCTVTLIHYTLIKLVGRGVIHRYLHCFWGGCII